MGAYDCQTDGKVMATLAETLHIILALVVFMIFFFGSFFVLWMEENGWDWKNWKGFFRAISGDK